MSDYFKRFGQWQNYAHYALLALILTVYYSIYGDFTKTAFGMGFELAVALFLADSFVHGLFWVLPRGKGRWRD